LPGIADSGDYGGNGRRLQGKLQGRRCPIRFGSGDDSLNLLHALARPGKAVGGEIPLISPSANCVMAVNFPVKELSSNATRTMTATQCFKGRQRVLPGPLGKKCIYPSLPNQVDHGILLVLRCTDTDAIDFSLLPESSKYFKHGRVLVPRSGPSVHLDQIEAVSLEIDQALFHQIPGFRAIWYEVD
jgi:hypothetical protein